MRIPRLHRSLLCVGCGLLLAVATGTLPDCGKAAPWAGDPTTTPLTLPRAPELDNLVYLPIIFGPQPARLVIAAAHIDSAISYEPDEAILLWNIGAQAQPLAGWQLASGSKHATFPISSTLEVAAGQRIWCTAKAAAFAASFGETAACEWSEETDPAVPDLEGSLSLANNGGSILLRAADGAVADVLVYGDESQPVEGWEGAPAQLYTRGLVASAGQVWQRKLDPASGWPVDTDRAADWSGDLTDLQWGRQVRFPGWQGWDAASRLWPPADHANATVAAAVGPEGLFQPIAQLLSTATNSIDLSIYTLEHPDLAMILAGAARRGVRVRILLDGAPPGGISDLQKWCVAQIAAAGGDVRYLAVRADAPRGYRKRYRFTHAKFGVVDTRTVLVGTENFNMDAMPRPAGEPVGGRRGFYLFTDAPPAVSALQQIFAADWDPDRFLDLRPFDPADPKYGGPPPSLCCRPRRVYAVTESPFADTLATTGEGRFAVVSAPENATRPDTGLNALIARAGAGDEIVFMQLSEDKYWGDGTSNPVADPNPRLQALIAAARRGAHVRLLLDSFFDDPEALRSNRATVAYVRAVAAAEGLPLDARLGNPTLGGIHAKLALLRVGSEQWSAVGSLNGGEVSHKLNREVVLLVDQAAIYDRLHAVFEHDWALGE